MVFNVAASHAVRAVARTSSSVTPRGAQILPLSILAPISVRFLTTPPPSKPAKTPKSTAESTSTSTQHKHAGAQESSPETSASAEPELNLHKGSSLFDIDTSASPLASELIESQESAKSGSGGDNGGGAKTSTGAKSKTGARSMSSIERRRQHTVRLLTGFILAGAGLSAYNLGRPWDNEIESSRFADSPDSSSFFGRIKLRLGGMYQDFNKPVFDQLLPDPLPFPYSRPFTMVIDLDDLLVHSEWSREHGWRTAKRPGLDQFLGYLSQFYEIVIFTTQPFFTAGPIIEKLDPDRRFVAYTLFRESCRSVDGKLVKDLNHLNRDISKVIVVDTNQDSFHLHPENGILIKPWKGEKEDRELVGLIPFFEAIGIYNIEDVRSTIRAYEGSHIPTEHAKRAKEIREREIEENQARVKRLGKFGSVLGGISRSQTANMPVDKTIYDLERERFVQAYLEDQKFWKENGDAMRKQAKEEQERQIREMKLNTWGFFTGGMKGSAPAVSADDNKQP
ncbi:probable Mitochondrial import inner membrane translocase subunit TIM50 [Melanopsichium pennsylvanicum]|uniref:Mitochondrial import inner membrane translocase subunit TIM50 n=2 Tax=Melanopsichium pennsylvanicum TaxID=63383 RepID=A0AAJ4XHR4_9BASI|nr:related to TIM50-mitochondrial inner membrane import translocase subunit [Melanopsichium pennsylvanicum 4]SNX82730.1 probable Mitochondrial import inner membrane translocase subunit TIM50 [Melanopsichium pennsylvanicum]